MKKIILATSSPYRREIFQKLGIDFISESSGVNENFDKRPKSPKELVKELARLKTEAVSKKYNSGIIIGFDSVGYHNKKILEKTGSKEEVIQRLNDMAGNTHKFYTWIYMKNLDSGENLSEVVKTKVKMRNIRDSEIKRYLEQDTKFGTHALGYDPLNYHSSTFVKRISGSYNNFIRGMPVEKVLELLHKIGYGKKK